MWYWWTRETTLRRLARRAKNSSPASKSNSAPSRRKPRKWVSSRRRPILYAKFAAATAYDEADYKAYNDLKARYDHQMHEWEKASYELELVEEQ